MAPELPLSRTKLSYPLNAADFDPSNQDFLLVGGGGGSSSTGVPNKISLIDSSPREQLREIADIELAKDEDSVTTLAIAESSTSSLTAFAGINSSAADQAAGKNEHLRSIRIGLPTRKRKADGSTVEAEDKTPAAGSTTQALGRTAVFTSAKGPKNDMYQRVLRFSPFRKESPATRLAAIASGLAPENEIVVFLPRPSPGPKDEVSRIRLGNREAADIDLTTSNTSPQDHVLAYCTDDEVFVQQLSGGASAKAAPRSLYQTLESTTSLPTPKRPRFRALRFLTPRHLLLVQNLPNRTGVFLLVLKLNKDYSQAQVTIRKKLGKAIKAAVGLDVCPLTESEQGEKQLVIAVAGQNSFIELLTIDYSPDSGLRSFRPYTVLEEVHNGPLTKLVFSNFIGPSLPVAKDTGPQSIRLASVGVDQFVTVHYLPLRPFPAGQNKTPRYVLVPTSRSESIQTAFSVIVALVVVAMVAFLMQAFSEIRGAVPPILGATDWLSPRVQSLIARPYIFADGIPHAQTHVSLQAKSATQKLKDIKTQIPGVDDIKESLEDVTLDLSQKLADLVESNSELETPKAIIVRDAGVGEISTELRHDADLIKEEALKKWEELSESQKKGWKRKLKDAGHWAENQGESILKGILFSELAGAVGEFVRGG
ncbi:uncharacterized protein A1O9_02107 [Exophiala aquamarina CBS 119918]|uniref:Guanine nucleotide-exchange factor SEC12 n=1 Tax=Exophiala aquamarina CBS 119918 TaxID=1182545 RepID=A0A072PKY9_9EURO|nr:uncharacterized protein A1O9_02107 [Exophiala aquamarina CBS 119918]KEF60546.1 hypothetical protein A1O9_02107 [Exophiala aquamarina CBS 119918]